MWAVVGLMAVLLVICLAPHLMPKSLRENQSLSDLGIVVLVGGGFLLVLLVRVGATGQDSWRSRKMQDPVQAQALVVSASAASPDASAQNYSMTCVVSGPGLAATTVEHRGMVKTSQYPMPGATLPVTVDRADPTRLKILWDQVPTGHERGLAQAQALAAQMQNGASAGSGGLSAGSRIVVQGQVVDASGGSPAQRLAELDDLHAKGLLTDDEYGEQRGKIIGSI